MKNSTELIILNHTKFRENSIVIHTLSQAYGRRSFLVRVGRKSTMSLFLPLNILEADVTENPKATLWTAAGLSVRYPLNGIRSNLYKNTMTLFMSEVLYRVVKDGAFEEGLYEWCSRSILTLDALDSDFSNFHLLFLLELAVALGFSPTLQDIAPFAGEHLKDIRDLMQADFSQALLLPLNGETRNAICEDILRYLEFHTESRIDVRSLAVLRELYV
ncbi:MAG: DNA repair protein RecO C-terminal domain-containing protein [Bacteroidales bacterium]|nr:DNA repair protein RecO C-terminal domain-containing protein [Bacteroidales bacterium]